MEKEDKKMVKILPYTSIIIKIKKILNIFFGNNEMFKYLISGKI